jgi:transposase
MFPISSQLKVTLVSGSTDIRKAIDGLSNTVVYELEQEPCSEQLFVFCGRRRDKLKTLQWVNYGFWLLEGFPLVQYNVHPSLAYRYHTC